jgi:hypothetical protein
LHFEQGVLLEKEHKALESPKGNHLFLDPFVICTCNAYGKNQLIFSYKMVQIPSLWYTWWISPKSEKIFLAKLESTLGGIFLNWVLMRWFSEKGLLWLISFFFFV